MGAGVIPERRMAYLQTCRLQQGMTVAAIAYQ